LLEVVITTKQVVGAHHCGLLNKNAAVNLIREKIGSYRDRPMFCIVAVSK